jgi:alpha-glucosidase
MSGTSATPWWRHAVVYQIYVRSFADGDGDGTGDLAGLRSRLPYVASLGVDAIWLNPWYRSPLADGGYDVADYRDIEPRYGTLAEAEALIAEAHDHGIRVLADLVPNHTSEEHEWFRAAVAAAPGDPARSRYHFRPGKGEGGTRPPTDWLSVFGGPAWSRLHRPDGSPEQWYLHLFDSSQPDLNWADPEVRAEFCDVLRFWLDRGIDGFRVDVAHGMAKHPDYPDVGLEEEEILHAVGGDDHPFWDRDELHEIVREWRGVLDEYPGDRMMVAEAWVSSIERMARYVRPGEYHQTFNFDFLLAPWDAGRLGEVIDTSVRAAASVGSTPTWVLSNHDVVRHPTRYGLPRGVRPGDWLLDGDRGLLDPERGATRARAALLLMLALPGSVYLYQGEELGLPEVHDLPIDVLDDPVWFRSGHTRKGRDGCRVPIPWRADGPSFGFGEGAAWLPQPSCWGEYAVERQDGVPGSFLELYRAALRIRRTQLVADDELDWLDGQADGVLALRRGSGVRCLVNLGTEPVPLPDGQLLLASGPLGEGQLPPDAAVWVREA